MGIWAHQAAPDLQGPTVGYHIPKSGQTNYPAAAPLSFLIHETLRTETIIPGETLLVRPILSGGARGAALAGRAVFAFDDILTFTPDQDLQANTTYEVLFPAGGIKDAVGNGMETYRFEFSTGSAVTGGSGFPAIASFTASLYPAAPGQSVTLTAQATDPQSLPLEYKFDFGDSSPATDWMSTSQVAHTYSKTGHFNVTVQVRNSLGSSVIEQKKVTVSSVDVNAAKPVNSSPIVFDESSQGVWNVNPDNDSVTYSNKAQNIVREVALGDGCSPQTLAVTPQGSVWVPCFKNDQIKIVSATGVVENTIAVDYGSAPFGILMDVQKGHAFVTMSGKGTVVRYALATRAVVGTPLALGPTPRAMALTADGARLLVTRFISPDSGGEVWDVAVGTGLVLKRTIQLKEDLLTDDSSAKGR
jgi:PKD repeat protein